MTSFARTNVHKFFLAHLISVALSALSLLSCMPFNQKEVRVKTWELASGPRRPVKVTAWCVRSRGFDLQLRIEDREFGTEFSRLTLESSLDVQSDCERESAEIQEISYIAGEQLISIRGPKMKRQFPIWLGTELKDAARSTWERCVASTAGLSPSVIR